mmetsp:Transcript_20932/g.23990  ORF Transcript_20932/g.23990 Transcript_20932/m.23990 type:complete len:232 (+) Transcript_20932:49-744(+)
MKLLLISSFYNNALVAVTTLLVVVVLLSQESFAFRRNNDVYHIPLNHGDIVLHTLQFRGGSKNDIINPIDDDNDKIDEHTYTNIAGIQMDASFRGGGQYQRQHYSTATTPRTGGFIQRQNNLVGRLPRRLRDMHCTVNEAYNNYLVKFYWSQVTKGCSLHVPDNNNPSDTDALLAVQVRGGADDKKNQNHNIVNDSTTGIKRTAADFFYSLLTSFLGFALGFWLGRKEGTW